MTEPREPVDRLDQWDRRRVRSSTGILDELNRAGLLDPADIHVATRLCVLGDESDELVRVAVALAVRAVAQGSVCVDLAAATAEIHETRPGLRLPEPREWLARLAESALVSVRPDLARQSGEGPPLRALEPRSRPIVAEFGLLYLDRYHRLELQIHDDLIQRATGPRPLVHEATLTASLDRVFPPPGYVEQRHAAAHAARSWTTVLTGGPGTGKTTTVAGLLGVLLDQAQRADASLSIALTAPTGKATARLAESVQTEVARLPAMDQARLRGLPALTLHRLLGWVPDNATRFHHHRGNRLKYDVIVVDETSMVDLLLMGRLLEAVRPDARLILVGDPDQLTSVGAGAVLSDLVQGFAGAAPSAGASRADRAQSDRAPTGRPQSDGAQSDGAQSDGAQSDGAQSDGTRTGRGAPSPVVTLSTTHRFGTEIGELAAALRRGDADRALAALRAGGERVAFIETDQPAEVLRPLMMPVALTIRQAALGGDAPAALAALGEHRLICAHRDGPSGVAYWNRQVEQWLAEATGQDHWPLWYAGRPLLVTRNDYSLGIYNGEVGVCVRSPSGALRGLIGGSDGILSFATTRLTEVTTMHAITVHKSQGSQAAAVTVLLPPEDSRLLTRELLYTAVTRAERTVRVVGSEAEVRAAIGRRARRASGLAARLGTPGARIGVPGQR
ncbi:MAG: exodeoxyribonuclease V subunit alpha [Nocardioides sp.]